VTQPILKPSSVFCLAFPDYKRLPAELTESLAITLIASEISFEFFDPKLSSACGRCAVLTSSMSMPETPMDKQRHAAAHKDNIRITWKILTMKAKPVTHSM
jgi:hypothetical protein